jgi:hypothetical protein
MAFGERDVDAPRVSLRIADLLVFKHQAAPSCGVQGKGIDKQGDEIFGQREGYGVTLR